MRPTSPALFLGTRCGLFRWHDGVVAPIGGGSDPIESLLPLSGGGVLAGTAGARVLKMGSGGRVAPWAGPPANGAVASMLLVPGTRRVLAGTHGGVLFVSDDVGASFGRARQLAAGGGRVELVAIPGRPRSLLAFADDGVWHSADAGETLASWAGLPTSGVRCAVVHPYDPQLWVVATRDALLRSLDGARTFRPVEELAPGMRVRALRFEVHAPHRLFVLADPGGLPPEPAEASPFGWSDDAGRSFTFAASRLIDRARDPSGELTALAVWRDHDRTIAGLGTDRGELLLWRGADAPADRVADALPPIATLAPVAAAHALDPSTSGIHLLP